MPIFCIIFAATSENQATMTHTISVGIPTAGAPRIRKEKDYTVLENMLIGKDFHWQQSIVARLPGEVEVRRTDSEAGCSEEEEFGVINRLSLETYLRCVVGSEMNPNAPEEFMKAHAVISRSWALGKVFGVHSHSEKGKINTPDTIISWEDTCDHHGFDVCSDDHCQRYQGLQPIPEKVLRALEATEGEVLIAPDGRLVDARFSKCCGGRTEVFASCWQSREEACLESFDDHWCNLDSLPPEDREAVLKSILKDYDLANGGGFRWETTVSADEIRRNLRSKFGRDIGEIQSIEVLERGSSGRVITLRLTGYPDSTAPESGKTPTHLVIGKELMIRRLLAPTHLYSSWFDIEELTQDASATSNETSEPKARAMKTNHPREWLLKGHGWGHGVGLCQVGAARMALAGHSYREILQFYYPGARIEKQA